MLADLLLGHDPSFEEAHRAVAELPDLHRALPLLPHDGRMLRSHEQWRREYRRAVYLVRDPRDVLLSYFRYRRWLREFSGSLDEFASLFVEARVDSFGRWDQHVESWLRAPAECTLVLRFEDIVADPFAALREAATFLNIAFVDDEIVRAVADNQLARMRAKEEDVTAEHFREADGKIGRFIGGGKAAGWRDSDAASALALVEDAMPATMDRLQYGRIRATA